MEGDYGNRKERSQKKMLAVFIGVQLGFPDGSMVKNLLATQEMQF